MMAREEVARADYFLGFRAVSEYCLWLGLLVKQETLAASLVHTLGRNQATVLLRRRASCRAVRSWYDDPEFADYHRFVQA